MEKILNTEYFSIYWAFILNIKNLKEFVLIDFNWNMGKFQNQQMLYIKLEIMITDFQVKV